MKPVMQHSSLTVNSIRSQVFIVIRTRTRIKKTRQDLTAHSSQHNTLGAALRRCKSGPTV